MPIKRRSLLGFVGAGIAAPVVAPFAAHAATAVAGAATGTATGAGPDSPFGERSLGSPTAKVTVQEYFSLTCTHCAYFANHVMPEVKAKLIDPGTVRIVYHDFPLDQVALMAAQVARYLPPAEYYPFISALFASQNQWAFTPGINYTDAIFRYAALAGMSRATFDAAIADTKLKNFILKGQQVAETKLNINATPTFLIGGQTYPGALEYNDFAAKVTAAMKGA